MSRLLVFSLAVVLARAQTPAPEAQARHFLDLLVKRDFTAAHAMFDDTIGSKLSVGDLEIAWGQVQKGAGMFRHADSARTEASSNADVVFLTCVFEKASLDMRLPLDKAGRIGGLNFTLHVDYTPPDYVTPSAFHEKEVTVGAGMSPLHGALAIPNGDPPFPAVVLVHGSGPADRDSTVGAAKPFRDLAWGLASRGVLVLRYNKRANEYPREVAQTRNFTVKDETIDDALAGVALLMRTEGVDPKRVFVLGHSLGATVAPRIGKANPGIAGLIIVGATTHTIVDVLVPQVIYNLTLHGAMGPIQQKQVDALRAQVARANDPALTPDAPNSEMPLGIPASYWLDLRGYHPEQVARGLSQPLFILQGERDYQVTMDDFAAWKKALEGKKNAEFKSYPKLNHMFVAGDGPSSDEEYTKPGHVDKAVIEDVAAWIKRH